jgi:hydroxymethylbilane synthase
VGTSSLRRQAQLRAMREDLELLPLRGNVDTRLRKLQSGDFDGIILAAAGIARLGLESHVRHAIEPHEMCPAAGQGALAIETRADDLLTIMALAFLDHPPSRAAVDCERAALSALGGGCQVPIGALAQMDGERLTLQAVVANPNGGQLIRECATGDDPHDLGQQVGQALLARGAQRILESVYASEAIIPQQP